MRNNKILYSIYFTICSLIGVYFLFTGSNPGNASSGDGRSGVAGNSHTGSKSSNSIMDPVDQSIFDTGFFQMGAPKHSQNDPVGQTGTGGDEEPDILDPADKDNPVNPQTGRPFANSVMNQFSALRKKFPNNSIIPRKKTPEDIEHANQERRQMYGIKSLISQGNASTEDITRYYEYQSKSVQDRLELLSYVMEKYQGKMSDEIKEQYKKVLKMNQNTLNGYEKEKQNAIEKSADNSEQN